MYLKVYLFNVTNSELVRKGALPKLQELKPYVFRENRTKIQIHHQDATDTVNYKERISYHFEAELSEGTSLHDVLFKGWKVDFLEMIEQEINPSLIPINNFGYFAGVSNLLNISY